MAKNVILGKHRLIVESSFDIQVVSNFVYIWEVKGYYLIFKMITFYRSNFVCSSFDIKYPILVYILASN